MSSTINHWQVFCVTEDKFTYGFLDGTQTCNSCFTDRAHTINEESISIIDTIKQNVTLISTNDNSKINGDYINDCYPISITSGVDTVTTFTNTYSYEIGILSFYMDISSDNIGDKFDLIVRPKSSVNSGFIGVLGGNVNTDDTEIDIGGLSVYFKVGYFLVITDGVHKDDIEVKKITGNILTLKTGLMNDYNTGSYVSFNLKRLRNYTMATIGYRTVGNFLRISTFPVELEAVVIYTNKTANAKQFVCGIEYLC